MESKWGRHLMVGLFEANEIMIREKWEKVNKLLEARKTTGLTCCQEAELNKLRRRVE